MRLPLTVLLFSAVAANAAEPAKKPTPAQLEFFEAKVRPVLAEHCYSCHGEKKQSAGLRLDTAKGMWTGTDAGPAVVPGDPAKSRLIKSVRREGDAPMPPKAPLPPAAVAVLTEWVSVGAPYPDDAAVVPAGPDSRKHWAFQPVKRPAVPETRNPKLETRNEIDAFVGAKLAEKGLSFAPVADKRTLVRRAYFDLIGLPPTADEIEAFEKDASPEAFAKVVDRLLASPRYGERWGRYWLDVARYADTKGYVFQEDRNYPFAYTYRDYVINSFNADKPFDRFVVEQLAADKLNLGADKTPLAAMGFLTVGRRFLNNSHDIIDDRIDVVARGLMGLTVTCARCHDHKYDPIPAKDYYSLYGVFASSVEPKELPLIGESKRTPELEAFEKEVATREQGVASLIAERHAAAVAKLRSAGQIAAYLLAAAETRGMPNEQLQAYLRDRDLSGYMLNRWKPLLADQSKAPSPVFAPYVALAAIPTREFAAKAPGVLEKLAADPRKPVNPLVMKAIADAKPATLKDAVTAFATALAAHAPPVAKPAGKPAAELAAALGAGSPPDVPAADFDKIQTRADRDAIAAARRKVDAFRAASPVAPPRAMVMADGPAFQPVVFLRGNPGNRGAAVPRQFLEVVSGPDRKPFTDGSGRLELAKAVVSKDNPLTARVFVNRVWGWHFGRGLVRTPSDFGVRSEPPTHPELLDFLAAGFVEDGWSVKRLHRRIMLSATYQQGSGVSADLLKSDPDNRWLARQNRRRLDFEGLRDSMLFAAGQLDLTAGGKAVDLFKAPFTRRRAVYGFIDRQNVPGTFRSFDVASPDQHAPLRFQTTVPQQALFLMNSPFVSEQAAALAARPAVTEAKGAEARVAAMYRAALGRGPTAEESAAAVEFVGDAEPNAAFGPWPRLAQVLLLSNEFAFAD